MQCRESLGSAQPPLPVPAVPDHPAAPVRFKAAMSAGKVSLTLLLAKDSQADESPNVVCARTAGACRY
jgi:hypothetical protein